MELDGAPVPVDWRITEVYAGPDGWLIRSALHAYGGTRECICNDEDWPCQQVECGHVALHVGAAPAQKAV